MKIFCKFPNVNVSKLNFWLVICIAKNFVWTTLKAPSDFQIVVSWPNIVLLYNIKLCRNETLSQFSFNSVFLSFLFAETDTSVIQSTVEELRPVALTAGRPASELLESSSTLQLHSVRTYWRSSTATETLRKHTVLYASLAISTDAHCCCHSGSWFDKCNS